MSEASATAQEIIDQWETGLCTTMELRAMIELALAPRDATWAEARAKALQEVWIIVQEWERAYPESVFPPFTAGTPDLELSRDRIAAAMARHMARELFKQINALAQTPGG